LLLNSAIQDVLIFIIFHPIRNHFCTPLSPVGTSPLKGRASPLDLLAKTEKVISFFLYNITGNYLYPSSRRVAVPTAEEQAGGVIFSRFESHNPEKLFLQLRYLLIH
jgi:hypothetical protein